MKVIGDHLYVGAEAGGHGLQIFDMKKLLSLSASSPKTFSVTTDLTAWYRGFGSSHNIVANPDTNFIYAVGTAMRDGCRGGLWMVNVTDPARPTSPGCVSSDGYVHDAQCVVYTGPDTRYSGHEICFNFNEDTLTIVDVTSKSNPVQLSRTSYDTAQYTHQGWLATPDMRFLLIDDELDEEAAAPGSAAQRTTTYIVDISKLTAPKFTGIYRSPSKSVDHNQYVSRGLAFQSNYGSGLRIVDVSSVAADPSGSRFKQTGFFDCYPEDDAENGVVDFNGSWSVYPYFASGYIILNSIERGVFSLKYTGTWPLTESA